MLNRALLTLALSGMATACSGSDASGPPIGDSAGGAVAGTAGSFAAETAGTAGAATITGTSGASTSGGAALGGNAGAPPMPSGGAGGSTSAGGSGAGTAGAAGGSQPFVGCSLRQYQLCDDFEGSAPGKDGSVWTVRNGFPTAVVTDVVHSGTHAVRIKANGQGGGGIQENKALPGNDYWLRVYIRLDAEDTEHEGFVVVNGSPESYRLLNNNGVGDGPNGPNGKGKVMLDRTSNERGYEISKTTDLPKGSWHCWEWHQTPTEIHTYLDGTEITDVLAPWPALKVNSLSFGFERYHSGPEGTVYYDDIALDTMRIGCN